MSKTKHHPLPMATTEVDRRHNQIVSVELDAGEWIDIQVVKLGSGRVRLAISRPPRLRVAYAD